MVSLLKVFVVAAASGGLVFLHIAMLHFVAETKPNVAIATASGSCLWHSA